jgi:hypothetical protein
MKASVLALTLSAAALASCGSRGPAWPKSAGTVASADWSEDGGESIAPHAASTNASAVERSAEPAPEAKAPAPAAKPAEPEAAGTGTVDPEVPIELPDEVLGEEIIIEIDE